MQLEYPSSKKDYSCEFRRRISRVYRLNDVFKLLNRFPGKNVVAFLGDQADQLTTAKQE